MHCLLYIFTIFTGTKLNGIHDCCKYFATSSVFMRALLCLPQHMCSCAVTLHNIFRRFKKFPAPHTCFPTVNTSNLNQSFVIFFPE